METIPTLLIERPIAGAQAQPSVRAVLLIGSGAITGAAGDELAAYGVERAAGGGATCSRG